MLCSDEFGAIQSLKSRGMRKKAVARILNLDIKTVRRYWNEPKPPRYQRPKSDSMLDPFREHLIRRMPETDFNASALHLDLKRLGFAGSYGLVKKFVRPHRQERRQLLEATLRFETGPGKQAQADWSTTVVRIGGVARRIQIFGLVLCYSRRIYAEARLDQNLTSLVECHENAFNWFGGLTQDVLYDNPKTIVLERDHAGERIKWNEKFLDFSRHWGYEIKLCKPYRARTKGKIESGVKYVKRNFFALYGHDFVSLWDLNEKLRQWCLDVADQRIHGTTRQKPIDLFATEALRPVGAHSSYRLEHDLARIVPSDCRVVYRTNRYSVPWRHAGRRVRLEEALGILKILCDGEVLAEHALLKGRHRESVQKGHFQGIPGSRPVIAQAPFSETPAPDVEIRNLQIYEELFA